MRKIFLFILLAQTVFLNCYSQDVKDKGYVSLSIGPSIPLGNFASTSLSDDKAGFAAFGGNLNLSYAKLLGKNFGIATELTGQINPLNIKAMEKSFAQHQFDAFLTLGTITGGGQAQPPSNPQYVSYQDWHFNKKSWFSGSFLVGGYGQFPLNHSGNISLTTKAMIGIMYLSSPQLSGQGYTDSSTIKITQSGATAFGFAYSFGAGLKYDFNKKISFLLNLEYLGTATINFKNVTSTVVEANGIIVPGLRDNFGNYSSISNSSVTGNVQQKLSAFNINVGVGLKL
ncbi:MAG TPA: hypothetical protein VKT28_18225 [Puia sp.]|nr:hypothetical protein [Puia sp.]